MKKLPVFRSVGEVYSAVARHYFDLLRAAPVASFAYVLGIAIVGYVGSILQAEGLSRAEQDAAMLAALRDHWLLLSMAPFFIAAGLIGAAVRWHRFVLLGERNGVLWGSFDLKYLWTTVKFILFSFLILQLIAVVGTYSYFIQTAESAFWGATAKSIAGAFFGCVIAGIFVGMFVWAMRASIAFPDAAMGGSGSLNTALDRTAGNGWRLVGFTLLVQAPLSLAPLLTKYFFGGVLSEVAPPFFLLITVPAYLFFLMISVAMLSVAYREIVGLPSDAVPQEAQTA